MRPDGEGPSRFANRDEPIKETTTLSWMNWVVKNGPEGTADGELSDAEADEISGGVLFQ